MNPSIIAVSSIMRDILASIPGIASADENPPEQLTPDDFPALAIYPSLANVKLFSHANADGNPTYITNHQMVVDLHADRRVIGLSGAIQFSKSLIEPITDQLMGKFVLDRYDGNVLSLGDPKIPGSPNILITFAHLNWGSIETIGYRFRLDLTLERAIIL